MAGPQLIHCSYHKCLTVYFGRVMKAVFNRCLPWSGGFRHYNSHLRDFYTGFERDRVSSVNNRCLDLERLGDFRLSRFVRDPRDLVVSGYFYHRRGAEAWVNIEGPTERDWYFANAAVPVGLREHGGLAVPPIFRSCRSKTVCWRSSSCVARISNRWRSGPRGTRTF